MESTEKLVYDVINGDMKAFEKLYNETSKQVYYTCLSFLKNEQDALDIMQDTYILALTHLQELIDKNRFCQWINQIAVNKCKNYLIKLKPVLMDDEDMEQLPMEENDNFLPESYITNLEKRKLLLNIMTESLSMVQYQTIILYYFDGLSVQEIADSMGCPIGTVTYRLSTARGKIKQGVMEYENLSGEKLYSVSGVPLLTALFFAETKNLVVPNVLAKITGAVLTSGSAIGGSAAMATKGISTVSNVASATKGVSAASNVAASATNGISTASNVAASATKGVSAASNVAASATKGVSAASNVAASATKGISTASNVAASATKGVSAASSATATAGVSTASATASAAAKTGIGALLGTVKAKVIAGVASLAVIGGVAVGAFMLSKDKTPEPKVEPIYESEYISVEYKSAEYDDCYNGYANGNIMVTMTIENKTDETIYINRYMFCVNSMSSSEFLVYNDEIPDTLVPGKNEITLPLSLNNMKDAGYIDISSAQMVLDLSPNNEYSSSFMERAYFNIEFNTSITLNSIPYYPYDECELVYSDDTIEYYSNKYYIHDEENNISADEFTYIYNNSDTFITAIYEDDTYNYNTYYIFPNSYSNHPDVVTGEYPDVLAYNAKITVSDYFADNSKYGIELYVTEKFYYEVIKKQ